MTDAVTTTLSSGTVSISEPMGEALEALRRFNYERIYLRPASVDSRRRSSSCCAPSSITTSLSRPALPSGAELDPDDPDTVRAAVGYVSGMTDRFACAQAVKLLRWPEDRLPRGTGVAGRRRLHRRPHVVGSRQSRSPPAAPSLATSPRRVLAQPVTPERWSVVVVPGRAAAAR